MKKAYTLIELIITIAIMAILSSVCIFSYKSYTGLMEDTQLNNDVSEVENILHNTKYYCYANRIECRLHFYSDKNEITLEKNNNVIRKYSLDKYFMFTNINEVQNGKNVDYIVINQDGHITNGCTITFVDNRKIEHKFTISVGVDNVEYKG